ncbi:imidazolonepropionase [Pseudotabrizicola sp. L79]|uniref:imidazolonepropionase n=1 Tax=Pseudotabrizicola sp. L79 TaxID=3118402 RepID=UPI002F955560
MILTGATLATLTGDQPYGLIADGALVLRDGLIDWVGPAAALPKDARGARHDLGGRLVTPALIDCHSHLVHGGNRAQEFEMRLQGASYEDIARAGGGILSTVTATRQASDSTLLDAALPRLDALMAEGVAVVEVKSGYGLDIETELKMLRVARKLAQLRPMRIVTTFLGAHAIPPEFKGRADDYLTDICLPALSRAHAEGLVDQVDGFCEGIAFTPAQIARVFDAARALGLPVKLHAEQLSHLGGTELACQYGALSADHVEYATKADAAAMAQSGTVAVLLPGAFYALRETQMPPIAAFRAHNVPMAVATDLNPGTSPLNSLLLAMNMACTQFRLTPEEALRGTTLHAARALGLHDCGQLAPGLRADLAIWNVGHPAELSYRIGFNPLSQRIFGGAF